MIKRYQASIAKFGSNIHPTKIMVFGYLFYGVVGWILLLLPACQKQVVSALDCFFISTSALTTTGLTPVDVGQTYSFAGQVVLFFLMQIGGIGYLTFSSFVLVAATNKLSEFREKLTTYAFSVPKGFSIREFIKNVIVYTILCEVIGAVFLYFLFKQRGIEEPLWSSIFHSVSAFCTAGFALFDTSFQGFKFDFWVNAVISILCLLGAVGFVPVTDFVRKLTRRKAYTTFSTQIILSVTGWILVAGTTLFFLTEKNIHDLTTTQRLLTSFFQVMSASTTAGFDTLPIGGLSQSVILLLLFVMVWGASPSGTGGGLKTTTLATLAGLVKSTLRGRPAVRFWNRTVSVKGVQIATASFAYYMFVLISTVFLLILTENKPFLPVLFEACSSMSCIGLTMGLTAELTDIGKLLISLLMFMGRVGILTFGIAISMQEKRVPHEKEAEILF